MKKIKDKTGFTLVEMLVAVAVLSLSIAGTFTAVQSGLQSSSIAKSQITAFYLAQEGMEFIKNIRDENALHSVAGQNRSWLYGLSSVESDPCYFGKTCTVDSPMKVISACSGDFSSCPNLKEDTSTGLFGYTSSWTDTNFKREIQIESVSANEVRAVISITFNERGTNHTFQVTESLFSHQ